MKKEDIVSKAKVAGVAAVATLTLASCKKKEAVTPESVLTTEYKVDSMANACPAYTITNQAIDAYNKKIQEYKDANKDMLKSYSKDYIKQNIKNSQLRNFLVVAMERPVLMEVSDFDVDESVYTVADVDTSCVNKMRFFRRNHRWYNDLVLYLTDKYNERQLLKGDFFKTINNAEMKQRFEYNTNQIEYLKSVAIIAEKRRDIIYNDFRKIYSNENQRKR